MSTATDSTVTSPQLATISIIPSTRHLAKPADVMPELANQIDDVESSGTGPEGRAPYGDSYKLNRFERPFQKDMTYISDMDIHKFGLSQDADWYYISVELIGNNPNNSLGINYGVEIDLDGDGFGDFIIWAHPPYTISWDTRSVQVFKDSNHDTGGLTSNQPDAVFNGNGYDLLIFDGGTGQNNDQDLAWVRFNEDSPASIQFAFKKSMVGSTFAFGVVSDAGLRDLSKFDYNDYFTEADAGSPVRDNTHFPLGSLYAVDNTCWEAYGINSTESVKFCSTIIVVQPTADGGQLGGGSSLYCSDVFEQNECEQAGCTCTSVPGPCVCP